MAPGNGENRQAPKTEENAIVAVDEMAVVIGSAMRNASGHAVQNRFITRAEKSGDPTHLVSSAIATGDAAHEIDRFALRFVISTIKHFSQQPHQHTQYTN